MPWKGLEAFSDVLLCNGAGLLFLGDEFYQCLHFWGLLFSHFSSAAIKVSKCGVHSTSSFILFSCLILEMLQSVLETENPMKRRIQISID